MAKNLEFPVRFVNVRRAIRVLPFTVLAYLALGAAPAAADRVLLMRPAGTAPVEQRTVVEASLRSALESLAYDVVLESEQGGGSGDEAAAPEDPNDFRALAELARCEFALAPSVEFMPGGYRLSLRVGYAPRTRLESLVVEVRAAREHERLVEVLRAVLRPEGMGDAATRFAGVDPNAAEAEARQRELDAQRAAEAEAQRAAEEEAQRVAAEQAAREAEERRQREELEAREAQHVEDEARDAWENRERYGLPERMVLYGNFGLAGVLNPPAGARGGMFATVGGRFGYSLESVPGLEFRGGLDFVLGSTGGMTITGGAVYLASPWATAKVHVGGGLELGYHQAFTGSQVAQFVIRTEAIVNWHVSDPLWLEVALPVFNLLSASGGVVTMGLELRAGTRF